SIQASSIQASSIQASPAIRVGLWPSAANRFQSQPSATKRRRDGGKRGICLGAVRPAGLRHVGPAAATFAAEHFSCFAHEIDGIKARGEIIGDADADAGFAIWRPADDGDHARTKLFLAVVGKAAQVFEVDPFDRARDKFYVTDRAHPVGAFAAFAGTRTAR